MLAFILLNLLISLVVGKSVINTDVAEIGLTICHAGDASKTPPTFMREFVNAIAASWPISRAKMTIGIYEIGHREKLLLPIPKGDAPEALKNTNLMEDTKRSNRSADDCVKRGLEKGTKELWSNLTKASEGYRHKPAKVFIGVTVFRTDDKFADVPDWKARTFNHQLTDFKERTEKDNGGDAEYPDVYVVLQSVDDKSFYYGIAWKSANGSADAYCCGEDVAGLTEQTLKAVRKVMSHCVLDELESPCFFKGENCVANITYEPPFKHGQRFFLYCNELDPKISEPCAKGKEGCVLATDEPHTAKTSWIWLSACLVTITIAGTVAIVAAVRQCISFTRQRRQERQRLAESGMVYSKKGKRRGQKSPADVPATMLNETKFTPTTVANPKMAVLDRTTVSRSTKSQK